MTTYNNFLPLLVPILLGVIGAQSRSLETSNKMPQRSLYTFGDSFVDPGNNNYLPNVARSNFPPYGRDFFNHKATGRFSNGLLFPDMLARKVGATQLPIPYLDPNLHLYLNDPAAAVSFASATSGYDTATSKNSHAIAMSMQLEYFKQYKDKLKKARGQKKAEKQISRAVFYINAGSDDFAFTFFENRSGNLTREGYEEHILKLAKEFIQDLIDEGAKRIAVTGIAPLGCIPIAITTFPMGGSQRNCIEYANNISKEFNEKLRSKLEDMTSKSSSTKIAYIDFELPLLEVIQNPTKYKYREVNKGCCGTGLDEIGTSCNQTVPVCADSNNYVFWDAAHPTNKTYDFIFSSNLQSIDRLLSK